jgi:hypothetical protein
MNLLRAKGRKSGQSRSLASRSSSPHMPSSTTSPTNGSMSPPLPDGPVPPPMPLSPDGLFCSHQEGGLALVGVIPLKETSLRIHGNGSFFLGM